jgi:hypothetical protein
VTRRPLAAAGALVVLAALTVAAVPGLLPAAGVALARTAAERVGAGDALAGAAALAVLYGLWSLRRGRDGPPTFVEASPERTSVETPLTGAGFDDRVAAAALDRAQREPVIERLRAALIEARNRDGREREAVARAVLTGEWTDDRPLAAFLGDERAPPLPVRARLYEWLFPERAFERRVCRAVDAIATAARGERS